MADGFGSEDVELEDMERAGSGRRGSTSFDGDDRGVGSSASAGSPLTSPMGSLNGDATPYRPTDGKHAGSTFAPEDARDDNDETFVPLAGINDDGYFGDAAGNWLNLPPRAEITFETRGAEDKTLQQEVLDFCNAYGASFFGGLATVAALATVLIVWAEHLQQRGNGDGG
jgi:hypothetical protein